MTEQISRLLSESGVDPVFCKAVMDTAECGHPVSFRVADDCLACERDFLSRELLQARAEIAALYQRESEAKREARNAKEDLADSTAGFLTVIRNMVRQRDDAVAKLECAR